MISPDAFFKFLTKNITDKIPSNSKDPSLLKGIAGYLYSILTIEKAIRKQYPEDERFAPVKR